MDGNSGTIKRASGPARVGDVNLVIRSVSGPFFSTVSERTGIRTGGVNTALGIRSTRLSLAARSGRVSTFVRRNISLVVISTISRDNLGPTVRHTHTTNVVIITISAPTGNTSTVIVASNIRTNRLSYRCLTGRLNNGNGVLVISNAPVRAVASQVGKYGVTVRGCPSVGIIKRRTSGGSQTANLSIAASVLATGGSIRNVFNVGSPSTLNTTLTIRRTNEDSRVVIANISNDPRKISRLGHTNSPFINVSARGPTRVIHRTVGFTRRIISNRAPRRAAVLVPDRVVAHRGISRCGK